MYKFSQIVLPCLALVVLELGFIGCEKEAEKPAKPEVVKVEEKAVKVESPVETPELQKGDTLTSSETKDSEGVAEEEEVKKQVEESIEQAKEEIRKEKVQKLAEEKKKKKLAKQEAKKKKKKAQAEKEAKRKRLKKAKALKLEKAKKAKAKKKAELAKTKQKKAEKEAKKAKEAKRLAEEKRKIKELQAKAKRAEEKKKEKSAGEKTPKKTFKPENMPTPAGLTVSPEAKRALAKNVQTKLQTTKLNNTSTNYSQGMEAYRKGSYTNSVQFFSKVPVPATKRKGDPKREEYVKANYFMGLAYQKQGKLSKAVQAYAKVLKYERYFPICRMNMGICYLELRKFGRADQAFKLVVRDQNNIPPKQYDDIMQNTRYFWALAWTRMYKYATGVDKKRYFMEKAERKWSEYKAWFGGNAKYSKANAQAENYIKSLQSK